MFTLFLVLCLFSLSQSSLPASAQVEFPGLCCWRVRWKPTEVSEAWAWDCVRGAGQTLAGVESTELGAARGAGLSLAARTPICLRLGQARREMARCCSRGAGSPWSGQCKLLCIKSVPLCPPPCCGSLGGSLGFKGMGWGGGRGSPKESGQEMFGAHSR